jgi:hypothetical protein
MPLHFTRAARHVLLLPSPHAAGYPADAASAGLFRRAAALQVLFAAADKLAFSDSFNPMKNMFFYALVARMSARTGLDSPQVAGVLTAATDLTLAQMWTTSTTLGAWGRPDGLRAALAITNLLLQDRPAEMEDRLFGGLRSAPDPVSWLAEGMNLPIGAAQRALESAAASVRDEQP